MNKYKLLELINKSFQSHNKIKSTSIDYKQTENKSGSMIVVAKDGDVFEIKIRRI